MVLNSHFINPAETCITTTTVRHDVFSEEYDSDTDLSITFVPGNKFVRCVKVEID